MTHASRMSYPILSTSRSTARDPGTRASPTVRRLPGTLPPRWRTQTNSPLDRRPGSPLAGGHN